MNHQNKVRILSAQAIHDVVTGSSLTAVLSKLDAHIENKDRALLRSFCFGTLRYYFSLNFFLNELLVAPIKQKNLLVKCFLLIGLYEIFHLNTANHAVVSELVNSVKKSGVSWAQGLVNGVLRNAIRQKAQLLSKLEKQPDDIRKDCPKWLLDCLQSAWPEHWSSIVEHQNIQAPLTLRVNTLKTQRTDYMTFLKQHSFEAVNTEHSDVGITLLSSYPVSSLPKFVEGWFSVQDEAAQLCSQLFSSETTGHILDACAAPGGKTCGLLERCPNLQLLSIDSSEERLEKLHANLARLGLSSKVKVICADVSEPVAWWDGQLFDGILLDAPCSGTGVIRRHPDIKLLRLIGDIEPLVAIQKRMLKALWRLLRPGGVFLYTTCSVLPQENSLQIKAFLHESNDSSLVKLDLPFGYNTGYGIQLFPKKEKHDGFFYSMITKKEAKAVV